MALSSGPASQKTYNPWGYRPARKSGKNIQVIRLLNHVSSQRAHVLFARIRLRELPLSELEVFVRELRAYEKVGGNSPRKRNKDFEQSVRLGHLSSVQVYCYWTHSIMFELCD